MYFVVGFSVFLCSISFCKLWLRVISFVNYGWEYWRKSQQLINTYNCTVSHIGSHLFIIFVDVNMLLLICMPLIFNASVLLKSRYSWFIETKGFVCFQKVCFMLCICRDNIHVRLSGGIANLLLRLCKYFSYIYP